MLSLHSLRLLLIIRVRSTLVVVPVVLVDKVVTVETSFQVKVPLVLLLVRHLAGSPALQDRAPLDKTVSVLPGNVLGPVARTSQVLLPHSHVLADQVRQVV